MPSGGTKPSARLNRVPGFFGSEQCARPITIDITVSNCHILPSVPSQPGTAMHPNPFLPDLPAAAAREILGTLPAMVPSPATDTQAARATRSAIAMAMVTSYRPAGVSDPPLAAQACHRAWPDSRQCRCPRQGLSPPRRPAGLPSRRHSPPACPGRRIAGGSSPAVSPTATLSPFISLETESNHAPQAMAAWPSFVIPAPLPPAAKQGETQMHADRLLARPTPRREPKTLQPESASSLLIRVNLRFHFLLPEQRSKRRRVFQ